MKRFDFSQRSLSSRIEAAEDFEVVLAAIRGTADEIVLDLGANLATTSWVDGFVAPLVRKFGGRVGVISTSVTTRAHLDRVLRSRKLHTCVASSLTDLNEGRGNLLPARR